MHSSIYFSQLTACAFEKVHFRLPEKTNGNFANQRKHNFYKRWRHELRHRGPPVKIAPGPPAHYSGSDCTRARFTVLMSCNDETAVRSCPLLCLHKQVAKLASGLIYCWFSLRNNNTAVNLQTFTSSYCSRRFSACDQQGAHYVFLHPDLLFLVDLGVSV